MDFQNTTLRVAIQDAICGLNPILLLKRHKIYLQISVQFV